jgi:hypothetical protein
MTFFCELETADLQTLFADPKLIADLQALEAGVSLALIDLSPARAEVVRRLSSAGIPVTAWLILPQQEGYYFCMSNVAQARSFYEAFRSWTVAEGLTWAAVGINIEPDLREMETLRVSPLQLLPELLKRVMSRRQLARSQAAYASLAREIRNDGYTVESYQFPVIVDERKTGSTLLRRAAGLVDVPADREVWMLYSSFSRPLGIGYLWSYAPEAQQIALGSTGGGLHSSLFDHRPLDWEEFARDLRLGWYWTDELYIFSLEGCVRQGFIDSLKSFTWDVPIFFPEDQAEAFGRLRSALQSFLWLSRHLWIIAGSALASLWLVISLRRWLKNRS